MIAFMDDISFKLSKDKTNNNIQEKQTELKVFAKKCLILIITILVICFISTIFNIDIKDIKDLF